MGHEADFSNYRSVRLHRRLDRYRYNHRFSRLAYLSTEGGRRRELLLI